MVINIGFSFGVIGYLGYVSYCVVKVGLYCFSEVMNWEFVGMGMKVFYLVLWVINILFNSEVV